MAKGTPNRRKLYKRKVREQLRKNARDGCTGKISYPDPKSALEAATLLVERATRRASVYICRLCNGVHVSSKPQNSVDEIYLVEREQQ